MRNAYCVMFKNVKINIFELKIARKLVKVLHNNEQCDILYKYTNFVYKLCSINTIFYHEAHSKRRI